jgi:hypothetical protein
MGCNYQAHTSCILHVQAGAQPALKFGSRTRKILS